MTGSGGAPLDWDHVRTAYDAVAEDYATYLPDTRAEAALDLAMVDAFAEAVRAGDDASVLDGGCGTGRMSRYLSERGCRVEGVDLSPAMVALARRDLPDLAFAAASLTDLPFAHDRFAGVLLWYSIIHTPPAALGLVLTESVRVLRPGGHLLVGFQAGHGTRDLSETYRRYGHELQLERYLHRVDAVANRLQQAGAAEVARLFRRPRGAELDDQAVLLARLS